MTFEDRAARVLEFRPGRLLLDNMPNHFLGYFRAPSRSFPAYTSEQPSVRNIGRLEPIVHCLLHLGGHWYRPNVPCFAYQIDDSPMVLATLKMVNRQLGEFPTPQTAT